MIEGACDTSEMVCEMTNGVERHTPTPNTPVYSNNYHEEKEERMS